MIFERMQRYKNRDIINLLLEGKYTENDLNLIVSNACEIIKEPIHYNNQTEISENEWNKLYENVDNIRNNIQFLPDVVKICLFFDILSRNSILQIQISEFGNYDRNQDFNYPLFINKIKQLHENTLNSFSNTNLMLRNILKAYKSCCH